VEVFQTAAEQNSCYPFNLRAIGRRTQSNCLQEVANSTPAWQADALLPLGPSVNAGAMLVRMPQLDGADPKLLSCETPTHLNVDAEKRDFLMNTYYAYSTINAPDKGEVGG